MTERKNFIKQIGNYFAEENKKYQEQEKYFCSGYLSDPPKDGQFLKQRFIQDGNYQLQEDKRWNPESNIWQTINREWTQTVPDPIVENKSGLIAGIITRCRLTRQQNLQQGFIDRKAFFAPPKDNEATQKSKCYGEDNEIFYKYAWNQERNIWDETGRYIVIRERGMMH